MAARPYTWDHAHPLHMRQARLMSNEIDYETLDTALKRCGAHWDAAQTHGLLSGRLATGGVAAGMEWLSIVLDGTDTNNALREECSQLLDRLFQLTYAQLAQRLSEFSPLLPDDADSAESRALAMGHWCEGYLHGLVSTDHGDALKQRLAAEPLADIIKDMLQITRAAVGEDGDEETNEAAYAELVEYLRVAAQLTYEELAEFRDAEVSADPADALH
jgi:yecA family protein